MDKQAHNEPAAGVAAEIAALHRKYVAYELAGTLKADGSPEGVSLVKRPPTRRRRGSRRDNGDAIAASRSLSGQVERTINDGLPTDTAITGKVGGLARSLGRRAEAADWHDPNIHIVPQHGVAITRLTRLSVPVARGGRFQNERGETSFHFTLEAISKTSSDGAGRPGKQAAWDHSMYIERDAAVARQDAGGLERHPGADVEANNAVDPDRSVAVDGEEYIVRDGALARTLLGKPIIMTNIDQDQDERVKFWRRVEARERTPGDDMMTIDMAKGGQWIAPVLAAPDCPPEFAANIARVGGSAPVKMRTGSNRAVRQILKRNGWKAPAARTGRKRSTAAMDLAAQGFAFSDSRAGVVQYRMVGEFPRELTLAAMTRAMKKMGEEFARRGLPYVAALHAPDYNNNQHNWHFHLIFHDQPAKRFSGMEADHIAPPVVGASARAMTLRTTAVAALADPAVQNQKGRWDFDVEYTRVDASRHTVTTQPFAQAKVREVNHKNFIKKMRHRFAEVCNEELSAANERRRYHPGKYVEMGINKVPDTHLGNERTKLERCGVPTAAGVRNERNEAIFLRGFFAGERNERIKEVGSWLAQLRGAAGEIYTGPARQRYDLAANEFRKKALEFFGSRYLLETLEDTLERARSRATYVAAFCRQTHVALISPTANAAAKKQAPAYQARLQQAEAHLMGVDVHFQPEITRLEKLRARLLEEETELTRMKAQIEAAVRKDLEIQEAEAARLQQAQIEQHQASKVTVPKAPVATPSGLSSVLQDRAAPAAEPEAASDGYRLRSIDTQTPIEAQTTSGSHRPANVSLTEPDVPDPEIGHRPISPSQSAEGKVPRSDQDRRGRDDVADPRLAADGVKSTGNDTASRSAQEGAIERTPARKAEAGLAADKPNTQAKDIDHPGLSENAGTAAAGRQPLDAGLQPHRAARRSALFDAVQNSARLAQAAEEARSKKADSAERIEADSADDRATRSTISSGDVGGATPAPDQIANRSDVSTDADKLETPRSSAGGTASEPAAGADELPPNHQANEIPTPITHENVARENADQPVADASAAKQFGVRTLGTSGVLAAGSAAKQDHREPAAAQSNKPGFDMEAARVRSENSKLWGGTRTFIKRELNLHPLIDAWIAADRRGDAQGSRDILAAIVVDPEASALADRFVTPHRDAFEQVRDNYKPAAPHGREESRSQVQGLHDQRQGRDIGDN